MALTTTTTLRIPTQLRDRLAEIAAARGTTMLDVVTDAVDRLRREEWWASVHRELDAMGDDDVRSYDEETAILDHAAGDGIIDG